MSGTAPYNVNVAYHFERALPQSPSCAGDFLRRVAGATLVGVGVLGTGVLVVGLFTLLGRPTFRIAPILERILG